MYEVQIETTPGYTVMATTDGVEVTQEHSDDGDAWTLKAEAPFEALVYHPLAGCAYGLSNDFMIVHSQEVIAPAPMIPQARVYTADVALLLQ